MVLLVLLAHAYLNECKFTDDERKTDNELVLVKLFAGLWHKIC